MKNRSYFEHVLELGADDATLFRIGPVSTAEIEGPDAVFTAPLMRQKRGAKYALLDFEMEDGLALQHDAEAGTVYIRARMYGENVVRLSIGRELTGFSEESPMLAIDKSLSPMQCTVQASEAGWTVTDGSKARLQVGKDDFAPTIFPDGSVKVEFQDRDRFLDQTFNAIPFISVQRANAEPTTGVSFAIEPGEHFCGTGERFDRIDLFGRTLELINADAQGEHGASAYKNIPFLLSSRPYGIFMHSSAKMKVDIGDYSKHSLQWLLEDEALDIFFIGGGSFQEILRNYRKLTGHPAMPPTWSFGIWMGRFTYWSADEVAAIGERLRKEDYPSDVIHIDTAWFPENFKVTWSFSKERFPDPEGFFREMRNKGFRISLWQCPYVNRDIDLHATALEKGFVGKPSPEDATAVGLGDTIDFTNPEAVQWYQGLLENVLRAGAAVIKADFGEEVDECARYRNMEGAKYRNLFSLLYQKAVWEITQKVTGEGIIWARSGWAGSQRYPVHWSGDCAATFESMNATLCGGLHLGLSGFAFWSHDCAGFHGAPDFAKSRPSDDVYLRWTQLGTFTSHMRYHGLFPHEPWEFPGVAASVRQWWRFRYALLPYLLKESRACCESGLPMLRSLVVDWTHDPAVWSISNQYMFGNAFMVCPIFNSSNERPVYLPRERWVDFWTGQVHDGPVLLDRVKAPLSRLPLYVRYGSIVEFAEPVQCTDELDGARRFRIAFDRTYNGFDDSELAQYLEL